MKKKHLFILTASVMLTFTSCSGFIDAILGVPLFKIKEVCET